MLNDIFKQLKVAFLILVLFTMITGFIYPLIVTGLAQLFFPWQANGSLIEQNGNIIGSVLIGQSFASPDYFWSRPSATSPYPYNAEASSGSNMGPSNPAFIKTVKERVNNLKKVDPRNNQLIPVDLVTASGSGLDKDISPLAAYYQAPRIARTRHISETAIQSLIQNHIQNRTFILLGEPRVNVLQLNIALNTLRSINDRKAS